MASNVAFVPKGQIDGSGNIVDRPMTREQALAYLVAEAKRADRKFARSEEIGGARQRSARRDACLAVAESIKGGAGKSEPIDLDAALDAEYQKRFSPDATSMFDEAAVLAEMLAPVPASA